MAAMIQPGWQRLQGTAKRVASWPPPRMLSAAANLLGRGALNLVFPRACASCRAELRDVPDIDNFSFCRPCYDRLDLLAGPTCRRCGGPVPQVGATIDDEQTTARIERGCYRCRQPKLWFDETIAAGLYAGLMRELLLRMKQAEGDSLSLAMGNLLWQTCRERLEKLAAIDVVVPIPLHWRRRLAHRTNSAAILAEVLARRLRAPVAERLLRRRRHTAPQHSVTPPQRWDNVRRAFSVGAGHHLNEAHVLLVDDILTTGATCSAAAKALRKAGARRVSVVVAARAIS